MKLEIGYNHPFEIRNYQYPFDKLAGTKILYLSDFHFNRFGSRLVENVCAEIEKIDPAIVLLGGDYADSGKGLSYFKNMMKFIARYKTVCAIPGNHDVFRKKRLREIVGGGNGIWLQESSATVQLRDSTIRIDSIRAPLQPDTADFSILLLHRPIDVTRIAHRYNVIFAGHLHGGQAVLWSTGKGLFPGRLLYKWNRLSADFGNCRYLISKGLGDTLPIRYNCPKDAILVEINAPALIRE